MRKKALLVSILVIAVIAITGFVWLSAQTSSAMRKLRAAFSEGSGRNLTVASSPHLSFWPKLELVLPDVAVSGTGDLPLLSAPAARLTIHWADLFSAAPAVEEIALVAPRLNLLIDRDGKAAWSLPDTAKITQRIAIADATVAYLDERSGQRLEVNGVNGILAQGEVAGGASFAGYGVWNDQHFEIDSFVKSLARLTQDGSPADISFRSPVIDLKFGGRLSLAKDAALAGRIEAAIPDMRALMRRFGATITDGRGLKFISFAGALDASRQGVTISDAKMKFDGMDGVGKIGLELNTPQPTLTADLDIDRFDIDNYLSSTDAGPSNIDFTALKGLNADIKINAKAIEQKGIPFASGRSSIRLESGHLDASLEELALFGGHGSGRIFLDGGGDAAGMQVQFNGNAIDIESLLSRLVPFKPLRGTGDISLSLAASGKSLDEMISTLRGSAEIELGKGALRGADLSKIITQVSQTIIENFAIADASETSFESLSASLGISDGIISLQSFSLASPTLKASLTGEVDLLRRAVDLHIDPAIADAAGNFASFPVGIIAKGLWSGLKIYPDMPGILENPVAGFAALKQRGLPAGQSTEEN